MTDKQEFNEGHIPEAIDRCHVIMVMIDELLIDHPAIVKSELDGEIESASAHIMNAYQKLSEHYVDEGEEMIKEDQPTFEFVPCDANGNPI